MFATFLTVALFVALAIQGAIAEFTISTPTLTQCQDSKISWQSTKGPYNLIVVKSDDPCGDPVVDLGNHDGTSMTWKATLPAGLKVELSLEDASGDEAWSGVITVADSGDASCVSTNLVKPDNTTPSDPTTLTVSSTATPSSTVAPVGAANAGSNPFSSTGAATQRYISTPVMALSALSAIIALAL